MANEKFRFKTSLGEDIVLPRFNNVPAGLFRKARKLEPGDQLFTFLEELLDEEGLALYDQLPLDEAQALSVQWQEDSGVTAGKSSGSSKK